MADAENGSQSAAPVRTVGGSLREFSRRIGVTDMAIRKAIKAGRPKESLGKTDKGRPFIVDFAVAEREWSASSRTAFGVRTAGSQASEPAISIQEAIHPGNLISASTLIEAQRLATLERARRLKLENDVAEGHLVPLDLVKKEAFEAERTIRENILNLPARLSGELAAETDTAKVAIRLDAALRDALNVAADRLLATVNE